MVFFSTVKVKHGVPQGSFLGPLLFQIHINDLSKSVSDKCSQILFADDTSFIITNLDETEFKFNINETFTEISGPGSSVGITTGYGLEGPDWPWSPPSLLYDGYRFCPGGKAAGAWC
jgi:hypothetical protein